MAHPPWGAGVSPPPEPQGGAGGPTGPGRRRKRSPAGRRGDAATGRGSRSPDPAQDRSAQERPQLAEDPGGRAPDVEPADPVAAVADPPLADVALDDLDRRGRQERATAAPRRSRRPRRATATSAGRRPAIATTGVTRKLLTGIQNGSSVPTIAHARPRPASSPISSAASRSAVATRSASASSARPPGKLTSPRVVAAAGRPLDEDDPAASPSASGTTRTSTAAGRASAIEPGHDREPRLADADRHQLGRRLRAARRGSPSSRADDGLERQPRRSVDELAAGRASGVVDLGQVEDASCGRAAPPAPAPAGSRLGLGRRRRGRRAAGRPRRRPSSARSRRRASRTPRRRRP